jgi:hypothetical protein
MPGQVVGGLTGHDRDVGLGCIAGRKGDRKLALQAHSQGFEMRAQPLETPDHIGVADAVDHGVVCRV